MKMGQNQKVTRRDFIRSTAGAVTAFTFIPSQVLGQNGAQPPSDKLNIAAIGAGGMGASNINQCSTENIVALCDVDDRLRKLTENIPMLKSTKISASCWIKRIKISMRLS